MDSETTDGNDDNNTEKSFEDGKDSVEGADESTMTEYQNDENEDSLESKESLKESFPAPLLRQIKQKVIEDSIANEKVSYRPSRMKPPVLSPKSKSKKPRKEKFRVESMEGNDPPDTIDVTCGHLNGILHKELFYCPGIHRACVELEDGTFVTPKRFMFMGEKARLKDWKNAIRWNGHQLRKHIEAGTLSFHKHEELCTGRCKARSPFVTDEYSSPKLKREKFEFETLGFSTESEQLDADGLDIDSKTLNFVTTVEENGCMKIQSVSGNDHSAWENIQNDENEQEEPPDIKPDVKQLQQQMMKSMQPKTEPVPILPKAETTNNLPVVVGTAQFTPNYNYNKPQYEAIKKVHTVLPPSIMNAVMPPVSDNDSTEEEDRLLWQGIVELGLIDEFFREIKASLDLLKNTMVKRLVPVEDSNRISMIVRQLGLMQKLKFKLEAHRTDMDRQRRRLDREMMDLQKKVKEYEHKKKLLERKTECFDQILEIPTIKNNPSVPIMVYPNQSTSISQSGSLILSSLQSSNSSGTSVSSNNVSPGSGTLGTATLAAGSKIIPGSRILVFPKQSTEIHPSPEGGLKITMKRKNELHDEDAPSAKQKESPLLKEKLSKINLSHKISEEETNNKRSEISNGASTENETLHQKSDSKNQSANLEEDGTELSNENFQHEEHNSFHEELNSSHEENTSVHSGSGDQLTDEKSEKLVKRSKRKRSLKTYDDYIK